MVKAKRFGLLLAPGAGSDSSSPALVEVENVVGNEIAVRRMDFPYRLEGRKAPDRQPKLVESVVAEAERFCDEQDLEPSNLFLGGRSMGGRMCSVAVAEGLDAAGLVLMSYPLHPPGKPEKLRTEHFPDIACPALFVSGPRDAFASVDELTAHTRQVSGSVDLKISGKGDHSMKGQESLVASIIWEWLRPRLR
jgi:uncharacterized protein